MTTDDDSQLLDPKRHSPASRDDELTAGVVLELDCGHVLHGPNELTIGWLLAKHDTTENEHKDWDRLTLHERCRRLAGALEHLASLDADDDSEGQGEMATGCEEATARLQGEGRSRRDRS